MAPRSELIKKISGKMEPSSLVNMRFHRYDIVLKTDADGNAVQMFIGKADEKGVIHGERYTRTLKYGRDGKVLKDHWEMKGKAS